MLVNVKDKDEHPVNRLFLSATWIKPGRASPWVSGVGGKGGEKGRKGVRGEKGAKRGQEPFPVHPAGQAGKETL